MTVFYDQEEDPFPTFIGDCEKCEGSGLVDCPECNGTGSLSDADDEAAED